LETGLRDALFRDARALVQKVLNDRTLIPDQAPARPFEVIHRDRTCQVESLFGRIELLRNYYYHTKAKTGRFPLDHQLDLVRGHLPGIARLICRASAMGSSYKDGAADLHAYLGLSLEERGFARLVADIVPELQAAQATLPDTIPPKPIPVIYVASDGTGVPLRKDELTGIKGKQADGSAKTREVKLGCVFTQTTTDEEGQPMRDPDSTTYIGTFENCREHGTLLRREAFRRGYATSQTTVCLGDGAPWIWENVRLNFPDAIEILDFYHASEHAGNLAKALHGTGLEAKAQQTAWCHQMKASNSAAIVAAAQAALDTHRPELTPEQITTIEREITYFTTNAARTEYGAFRAAGYFIGSGVVEAGCKTVVGQRLKQSGMFWSHEGGDDLLSLRCLLLGPAFNQTWQARLPILKNQRSKPPKWTAADN
jgi:hypothetical protein